MKEVEKEMKEMVKTSLDVLEEKLKQMENEAK